jgi:hypothetical protein
MIEARVMSPGPAAAFARGKPTGRINATAATSASVSLPGFR